ncbi:MAG: hypothetical protein ACLQPD_17855 [Desulfomonilaceae bacterium]
MSDKPSYEKPQLIDLNEPPSFQAGAACSFGTQFANQPNKCTSGASARTNCTNGTTVNPCMKGSGAGGCSPGINATGSCTAGAAR